MDKQGYNHKFMVDSRKKNNKANKKGRKGTAVNESEFREKDITLTESE